MLIYGEFKPFDGTGFLCALSADLRFGHELYFAAGRICKCLYDHVLGDKQHLAIK